jgi:hypothetical protein
VPAQPVDATPSDVNLHLKCGVYGPSKTGEARRDAKRRVVEPLEGRAVADGIDSRRSLSLYCDNMSGRTFPFGPLFLVFGLLGLVPIQAQVSQISDGCKPDTHRKVVIERIDFDGPVHLADSDVAQVVADVNQHKFYADYPDWLKNVTDDYLTFAWQNEGYMKVKVTAKATWLDADSTVERFLVTAHVDEGLQYHLGELQFVATPPLILQESEMRSAFPVHEGDLYDAQIVGEGAGKLSTMYNATAELKTETNDKLQRVSLSIVLRQKLAARPLPPPLHIGTVQVRGLDSNLESRLMSIYRPGDIYDYNLAFYAFIKDNQSQLPPIFSRSGYVDNPSGTIDLSFEFRSCPAQK